MSKQWALYLARTRAMRVINQEVRTMFEVGNMAEWNERLVACTSIRAIDKLLTEYQIAEPVSDARPAQEVKVASSDQESQHENLYILDGCRRSGRYPST